MERTHCKGCEDEHFTKLSGCAFREFAELVERYKVPLHANGQAMKDGVLVTVPNCYAQPDFIYLEKQP
ncbi:MAG: hypothetical protein CV089_02355 [Nitrospira sp. WS110]|nr:hypothetical protein [Nitrospira sp. WS110]